MLATIASKNDRVYKWLYINNPVKYGTSRAIREFNKVQITGIVLSILVSRAMLHATLVVRQNGATPKRYITKKFFRVNAVFAIMDCIFKRTSFKNSISQKYKMNATDNSNTQKIVNAMTNNLMCMDGFFFFSKINVMSIVP